MITVWNRREGKHASPGKSLPNHVIYNFLDLLAILQHDYGFQVQTSSCEQERPHPAGSRRAVLGGLGGRVRARTAVRSPGHPPAGVPRRQRCPPLARSRPDDGAEDRDRSLRGGRIVRRSSRQHRVGVGGGVGTRPRSPPAAVCRLTRAARRRVGAGNAASGLHGHVPRRPGVQLVLPPEDVRGLGTLVRPRASRRGRWRCRGRSSEPTLPRALPRSFTE